MSTNSVYSGFLSNFNESIGSGSNYDLLSTVSYKSGTYATQGGGNPTDYNGGYFTLGKMMIQFTRIDNFYTTNNISNLTNDTGYTITFPKPFSDTAYCVIVTPTATDDSYGAITFQNDNLTADSFNIYVQTITGFSLGTLGITYIAIGPFVNP